MSASDPCQRDECAARPAHLGGVHLDPSSDLWDGPRVTINALPHLSRDAVLEIQGLVPDEHRRAADVALYEMARKIIQLGEQVASAQVDALRQIEAAVLRAEDCEAHGADLRYERHQAHYFSVHADQLNAERVAWLGAVSAIEQEFQALAAKAAEGKPVPDAANIARTVLRFCTEATKDANRARDRFNAPTLADCDRAGKCEHPETEPHAACQAMQLAIEFS